MKLNDADRLKERIEAWAELGPQLEREREERMRRTEISEAIQSFAGLVYASLRDRPAEPTSGLVEQQAIFKKLRR